MSLLGIRDYHYKMATVQQRVIKYELDLKIDKTFQVDLIKATFLLHFSITIVRMPC
jgi:hypothetical protein